MPRFALIFFLIFASVTFAEPETVLFLGSSTIVNWQNSLSEDFPEYHAVAEGRSGSEYSWLIETARQSVRKHNPDRIVIYSGDNDLADASTPEKVASDFERTVELIRGVKPEAPIYVISIKPAPGRRELLPKVQSANALVRKAASRLHNVVFVDTFSSMMGPDGQIAESNFDPKDSMHIHLSPRGYRLWTSILKPHFKRRKP
jgi:lysophospholipase L1-like esterase